ncbi:MAG: SH3 domain-containing protein, partial [Thermomicrobiales bacterium]
PATPAASLPVEQRSSPASVVELETVPATVVGTAVAPVATPDAPAVATPQPVAATEPPAETTPNPSSAPVEQQANPETGDGTSGPPAVSDLPARTPASGTAATPASSPAAGPGAAVIVTNCAPSDVPAFGGSNASFITTADVNIRVGPGTDCDPAADILPQGTLLTVTSGPVIRDGEPGTTWVRVDVDGLEGWVSTEFLVSDGE